ncbi:MAG TPA: DUF456 domain-containing protein [Anaerolineales bacterium]|nr:DUF456 domain-containing protein [Anaerolineales bacterium]
MPAWLSASVFSIALVTMIVGLFGLIVPIFPGITVIWLASLGYGLVTQFTTLGWVMFAIISILAVVGVTIDNILMNAKAHKEGAAWTSLALGWLGGVAGTILLPPVGGLIAAPLVVLLVEYVRQHDIQKALVTVRGLLIGWGASFVVRFFIGLAMIGLWLVWALNNV